MTMPAHFLRAAALILGLSVLAGCASLPGSGPSAQSAASAREPLRLARLLRDNGRMMASYEIYARLDRQKNLNPRETLEYASVAATVLPPQDALPLFVKARGQLSRDRTPAPDEELAVALGTGRGQLALGQAEAAADSFRAALAIDADSVPALNGLGVCLTALGQREEAQKHLLQALKQDPSNPAARNNLALAKLEDGDIPAAIRLLDSGNAAETPTLTLNLALAHLMAGDEGQARRTLDGRFPGVQTAGLMDQLGQSAQRIRDGQPAGTELLAASRRPLPLESRQ